MNGIEYVTKDRQGFLSRKDIEALDVDQKHNILVELI
jgi:hypothetical protein